MAVFEKVPRIRERPEYCPPAGAAGKLEVRRTDQRPGVSTKAGGNSEGAVIWEAW